jgi:hypothetical protein
MRPFASLRVTTKEYFIKVNSPESHKELAEQAIGLSKQLYGFINYLKNRGK